MPADVTPAGQAAADQGLAHLTAGLEPFLTEARKLRARTGDPMTGVLLLDLLDVDQLKLAGIAAAAITRLVELEGRGDDH